MARQSILDYFLDSAAEYPSRTAALVKRDGVYRPVTWNDMAVDAQQIAAGLLSLGVQQGDRVCLMSNTRLEWVLCDMAILNAGGVTVPIYPSNLPDECQYIAENSGAVIIIAEDDHQVQKLKAERLRLPHVKKVVQLEGPVREAGDWVTALDDLKTQATLDTALLEARRRAITQDSMATIIYTSGTTGRPKGVMSTHDNLLYEAEGIAQIDIARDADTQLLFLPLAHSFAKVTCIAWLSTRHVLAFAENMQTLRDNMSEVRPTLMAGVPRVYEKIYAGILQKGLGAGGLAGKMFATALILSERNGEAEARGTRLAPLDALLFKLLKVLVFGKIGKGLAAVMGGRMRAVVSGGAPLSPKIAWFFRDAGLEVLEGFGLTETTAATCVNRCGRARIGTVGPPLPGTEVRLAPDGELLIRGRGVMQGYWQDPEATAAVFADGWFCTGDVAQIEADGSVRIVDRKKDIIVTAGGKNVAPQNIENLVKTHKLVSQVVVHGDKRKYLSALVTLDPDALKNFAEEHNLGSGSYAELTQTAEVYRAVQTALDVFNKQLASYETIKKFKILEHDFSQETGELTPSLKIKRKLVNQRYKSTFDGFYEDAF